VPATAPTGEQLEKQRPRSDGPASCCWKPEPGRPIGPGAALRWPSGAAPFGAAGQLRAWMRSRGHPGASCRPPTRASPDRPATPRPQFGLRDRATRRDCRQPRSARRRSATGPQGTWEAARAPIRTHGGSRSREPEMEAPRAACNSSSVSDLGSSRVGLRRFRGPIVFTGSVLAAAHPHPARRVRRQLQCTAPRWRRGINPRSGSPAGSHRRAAGGQVGGQMLGMADGRRNTPSHIRIIRKPGGGAVRNANSSQWQPECAASSRAELPQLDESGDLIFRKTSSRCHSISGWTASPKRASCGFRRRTMGRTYTTRSGLVADLDASLVQPVTLRGESGNRT